MSPSMVNARGQEVQAGRFRDLLAGRRRILQSQKKATRKTATPHTAGLCRDSTARKRRPKGHIPQWPAWENPWSLTARESLASQRPLTAWSPSQIHAWQQGVVCLFRLHSNPFLLRPVVLLGPWYQYTQRRTFSTRLAMQCV